MKYWVGVVTKDHVEYGKQLGIVQIGHGKRGGLARMHAGDGLIYYSPWATMESTVPLQEFTAIAQLSDDDMFEAEEGDMRPWRRYAEYKQCTPTPIRSLLDRLSFTAGKTNWGYAFRFGLLEISEDDFRIITKARRVAL
jgi:hypothetical protein